MTVLAIAQARMQSTRVPGKVMRSLGGQPVLKWVIDALKMSPGIDQIVLATSTLKADDIIESYCDKNGITCFRGSETDVLDRFYQCAKMVGADTVIRVTCDCPFLDPAVVGEVIRLRQATGADYATNTDPPTWPDGLDVECFTFTALKKAHAEAVRPIDRDCVTSFIRRNRSRFPSANLTCPVPGLHKERWVLDTEADWQFCEKLAFKMIFDKKNRLYDTSTYLNILNILDKNPELRELNRGAIRNERYYEALSTEELPARTFERSQRIFQRAIQTIPFAAQTFSKSHLQYPEGRSPLFVSHGDGACIYDVDGNDYVDLVNALLPVVLGYRDPDVDGSIRCQLDRGISFSLATELEAELSETLCRLIPCAEMVKFGKSGTDVTTAAVRLARAYTGRDHILVGGYHGWADWSMSVTERNVGIPEDVRKLSHKFKYGNNAEDDINRLILEFENMPAAIVIEPNDDPEYLQQIRDHCTRNDIILIFDEIITGFRYELGGAQALYGVTPDLACFGKSMANGMPISALVGRRDIMKRMEPPDNIFYSGTFFGETLSIAAAIATIKKMEECNVINHLLKTGIHLERHILGLIKQCGLEDAIGVTGYYPLLRLDFKDAYSYGASKEAIKTFFMQEMVQQGVLVIATNNLSYAHKTPELERIKTAYINTFWKLSERLNKGDIQNHISKSVDVLPLRQTA